MLRRFIRLGLFFPTFRKKNKLELFFGNDDDANLREDSIDFYFGMY